MLIALFVHVVSDFLYPLACLFSYDFHYKNAFVELPVKLVEIPFVLDMEEPIELPLINPNLSSLSTCICANEILIRNHLYIISMCINHTEQPQIEIKVEAKESADQWRSSFNATSKYFISLVSISRFFRL
jgi:hypothetical protein